MSVEDLARFGQPAQAPLNYLHFGDSMATLEELLKRTGVEGEADQAELVASLRPAGPRRARRIADAADVLRAVAGPAGCVALPRLRHDLQMSLRFRHVFRSLGCRGFSFRLREDPHFRTCGFSSEVSLKVALIADRDLYYPPNVRRCLPVAEPENRHVAHAIGWLFIMEKTLDAQKWWYVINVQSDLMSVPVSCLKEIFRGWQRRAFPSDRGVGARARGHRDRHSSVQADGRIGWCGGRGAEARQSLAGIVR